jgi:hypothetical protein
VGLCYSQLGSNDASDTNALVFSTVLFVLQHDEWYSHEPFTLIRQLSESTLISPRSKEPGSVSLQHWNKRMHTTSATMRMAIITSRESSSPPQLKCQTVFHQEISVLII